MKGNVIQMNTLHLNSVRLNGIGKVQSVSLKGGSTEDPVFPPVEPPVEPEPTPTYTLSASVTNGKVSATRNGSAVTLPFTANEGDAIVLEVTPNEGYAFEGWNDGNTDNPRSITMNADVALSAQCVEVVAPSKYIQFEDAEVERVLMSKGVSSDGVGITMEDAAAVTSISTWFKGNTAIVSFNELAYFTNVAELVASAFQNCTALTMIDIANVTKIGNYAFSGCTSLTGDFVLPLLTSLGGQAFYKTQITSFIANSVPTITSANQYGGLSGVFGNCTKLQRVELKGATFIGADAFVGCTELVSVALQDVEEMATAAFKNCSKLTGDFNLPNLTTLGSNVFTGTQITSFVAKRLLTIPNANQYGGISGMFFNCKSLKYVELEDITLIGSEAFYNCSALQYVIIRATTPPSLANTNAFSSTNNCPIYVPDASLEAYKTATNWNTYADRIHPLSEIEGSNGVTLYDRLYGDGVAYIQTEYFLKGNETIESVAMNSYVDRNNKPLWGAYDGTRKTELLTGGDSQSNQIQWVIYYGSSSYVASAYLSTNNRPKVLYALTPSQFGFDGLYSPHSGSSIGINAPFCIFADYAEREYKWKGWIGSVIITDTDTSEVLAKFTPASYNGEAGMYDEISGKFYGNAAASGAFYVENE